MRPTTATAPRRVVAGVVSTLVAGASFALFAPVAHADSAPVDATNPATPATVTADALPTVQINGVAWSQAVVGNTVYVAGRFTTARPAGAAAGTQETARNNLLAYDITTGNLITSFAPNLNAQALVVTASPDGSRIYVGGDFTSVNGQVRNRIAAFDTATGALVSTFKPSVSSQVRAIAATNSTVYLGGSFGSVSSLSRSRLAAVRAADGAVLPWAPVLGAGTTAGNDDPSKTAAQNGQTSTEVMALVVTGGGTQVVAAGRFDSINGTQSTGVGAIDPVTGATRPFAVSSLITNQGINSAVYSLSTDGTTVYGTGYDFYGPGNLEGSFAATADGGALQWVNDCHGDTYSSFPSGGALYMATHAHDCGNIGGFPEQNPRINKFATAVSLTATHRTGYSTLTNGNLANQPAPSMLAWFPTFSAGTVTGQSQAGWSVSGNSQYVVYGGEFPRVNGTAQQGLVRYAVSAKAPNKVGPNSNAQLTPTVVSTSAGTARVSWQSTWDQDNQTLTYDVTRADKGVTPVFTTTQASMFWDRPTMGFIDSKLTPGASYTYRVTARDAAGNLVRSGSTTVTVSADTSTTGLYADTVLADSPAHYWRLGEASGTVSRDQAGFDDLALGSGVTLGAPGALTGSTNTAAGFNGTPDGLAATTAPVNGPQQFTVEAWFSTTSTSGGKIVGFGNASTGYSSAYDRHVYLDGSGRVVFGVYPGFTATVQSGSGLNDGRAHHVVASMGAGGMTLYVDGKLVDSRADVTSAQDYSGFWRIGGDRSWGGADFLTGSVDEVAVYPTVLTAAQVERHFTVGSTGQTYNEPPVAAFTATTSGLTASLDASASTDPDGKVAGYAWDLGDGTTATGKTVTHDYAAAGARRVTLTVTDDRGRTATTTRVVGVAATGTTGGAYSAAVLADGAAHYWRLGESSGDALDSAGTDDLLTGSGLTRPVDAAVAGDADSAARFSGDQNGLAAEKTPAPAPNTFTVESWFRTTTTSGGKIVGFGNTNSGTSGNYDRHVYMDGQGRVYFGVWTGSMTTVQSGTGLNDGRWHHVVATLGGGGEALFIDGQLVDQRNDVSGGEGNFGYWRIGGDTSWAGDNWFDGDIDEVALYPTVLTAGTVGSHFAAGTTAPVPVPNKAPVAAFTHTESALGVSVDGSSSTDSDGTVTTYAWDFGDGATGTGVTATHTYATGGTFTVTLTVTDDHGAVSTSTSSVTVTAPRANQAPVAGVTSSTSGLTATLDGSSSTDSDGTVAGYGWDFGDGTTGTGATTSHAYTAAGTYTVTLTVTDDRGATGTTATSVTVTKPAPPAPPAGPTALAADAFNRTVSGGLGTADTGGAWTASLGGTRLSVTPGSAVLGLPAAGNNTGAWLSGSQTAVDVRTTVSLSAPATGSGISTYVVGRRVGTNNEYRARVRFLSNGTVALAITRLTAESASEVLVGSEVAVPVPAYTAGTALQVHLRVTGTGPTQLAATVWAQGAAEPTSPTVTRTDATASLQAPGGFGLLAYRSTSATTAVNVAFGPLSVTAP